MRLAACLILALAMPAGAAPIVDQEALPNGGTYWTDGDTATVQSFTVGQSGMLTRIDIWFEQDFGACSDERGGNGCSVWIPGGSDSWSVIEGPLLGWVAFEMLTPFAVTAGQELTFDASDGDLQALGRSDYAGVLTHTCNSDQCVDPLLGPPSYIPDHSFVLVPGSLAFRVWIEPTAVAAVPEPSGIAMCVIGGLLCARVFHRRP